MYLGQQTLKFSAASVATDITSFHILGPPVASTGATVTNSSGLLIGGLTGTSSIGANTTNGYGISCFAPQGAANNYAARFLGGNVGIGTSAPTYKLDLVGNFRSSSDLVVGGSLSLNTTTTSVNGSTSGTAVYGQPEQGSAFKKVIVYCNVLLGTASYTFPTPFVHTPQIVTTNGPAAGVVTALSTTAITITGATTTGFIILEGF